MKRLAIAFAVLLLTAAAWAEPAPDLVLRGTLSGADHQTYRLVPFDVPAGVEALEVHFDYTGREARTTIDLGLLGPGDSFEQAFRGWSGGNKRSFVVGAADATPSYLAAPVTPGRWNLLLGIPNIRSGQTSDYVAQVYFRRTAPVALRPGPAWYRGDLHAHTGHSDGSCNNRSGTQRVPCPLFLTLQAAADRDLDFIAITEHNTDSHLRELTALQPYFDRMLLVPGMELTTFQGHANAYGITGPIDFRVGATVRSWDALLGALDARGILVSVNHPKLPSGEVCMGCGWAPQPEADLSHLPAIEVVNGYFAEGTYAGIAFWHELLQRGYRPTGIGGSDTHDISAKDGFPPPARIGTPTTVVFAEELSVPALLRAIRSGNVFIDTRQDAPPAAPASARGLEFDARIAGAKAVPPVLMGGELTLEKGQSATFEVRVRNVSRGNIEVVQDGAAMTSIAGLGIASDDHRWAFDLAGDGARHWVRINVRDAEGRLALVGNPIYVNRQRAAAAAGMQFRSSLTLSEGAPMSQRGNDSLPATLAPGDRSANSQKFPARTVDRGLRVRR